MSAMTPEGKVKKRVVDELKKYGVYYFCPRGTIMGRAGVPDFVCCYRGYFLSIETKAGKNKPTALQYREMAEIAKAGGVALVINEDNIDAISKALMTIDLKAERLI